MHLGGELRVFSTAGYPLPAIVLKVEAGPDAHRCIAFAFGFFVNVLIARNVPHNFMVADLGCTIYLVPRRF